jgi:hypothetical protein
MYTLKGHPPPYPLGYGGGCYECIVQDYYELVF